jgi:putative phosphoesterase
MLIGIISDIHANEYALAPVLESARKKKVDRLFVLGDLVGYYLGPKQVLSLLSEWDTIMIRGNHEDIFASYLENNDSYKVTLREKMGPGFDFCARELDNDDLQLLMQLPRSMNIEIDGTQFQLCHGSPADTAEYIYPDASTEKLSAFDLKETDIVLMGHTHHPMIHFGKQTLFINPGSVGQSRITGGLAQWGIFNTDNKMYTPMNTWYDTLPLKKQLLENGVSESHFIYQVLDRNR